MFRILIYTICYNISTKRVRAVNVMKFLIIIPQRSKEYDSPTLLLSTYFSKLQYDIINFLNSLSNELHCSN